MKKCKIDPILRADEAGCIDAEGNKILVSNQQLIDKQYAQYRR